MPELGVHLWETDPNALAAKAADAEAMGFASVSIGDHVSPGLLSPFAAAAVIASATSKIRFGPLVLNNDLRHPVLVAQEAAALSRWSRGRFELGLGSGYNRREYAWLGIPFVPRDARAARLGEAAAIIRQLLAGDTVSVEGDHYTVSDATLGEPPPHVPILIGGNSPAVHRVAAEHGDVATLPGYSPGSGTNDYSESAVEHQVELLRQSHADGAPVDVHVLVQHHEITSDRDAGISRAAKELETTEEVAAESPYVLVGTPEQIAEQMRGQQERLRISRWTVFGDRPGADPAAAFVPVLGLLSN
jgi:probable F420-dependent oxidoreductase